MNNLNPYAFIILWVLTILMAGAIALSMPWAIGAVAATAVLYTIVAVWV